MLNIGLTSETLCEKLVGINTDGAAVNLGKKGGAVKLLIDQINQHSEEDLSKYMAVVHCVAHKLELAVCDAKKDISYLKDFERVLKGIFQLYYYSPKRRRELHDIAVALDQELKHYGGVQQVRWIASQNRALKALLDNYAITMIHLQDIATGKDDSASKARGYLNEMKTERFITLLHFLIDWTNLLTELSVLFQQKKCTVSEISRRVSELKDKFTAMKTRRGKVLRKFLKESADGQFGEINMTHRHNVTQPQIFNMLDELLSASEIFLEERFVKHLREEPLSLFIVFDFHQWPNKEENPDDFNNFGNEEIDKLVELYGPVLTDEERQSAADEWLDLKNYILRNPNPKRSLVTAYESILVDKDAEHLAHILPLVTIMLTISPTTAECERGFSQLNQVKTQLRTSLNQETLSALLRIRIDGPDVSDFNPTSSIIKWMETGSGSRHLQGHKCTGPRKKKEQVVTIDSSSDTE